MIANPITAQPEQSIMEVLDIMRNRQIGCLPVVKNRRLVGIITQSDFVSITAWMIKHFSRNKVH